MRAEEKGVNQTGVQQVQSGFGQVMIMGRRLRAEETLA